MLFSSCLPLAGVAKATSLTRQTNISGKLNTMLSILRAWTTAEDTSPMNYLLERNLGALNKAEIEAAINEDYRKHRTIEIEGMVLSKTECALVSSALTESSDLSSVT